MAEVSYRFYEELNDFRIGVYPMFESLDISGVTRLGPKPLRNPRFVLDTHLGKLARYLCLLGFDTLYSNAYEDDGFENRERGYIEGVANALTRSGTLDATTMEVAISTALTPDQLHLLDRKPPLRTLARQNGAYIIGILTCCHGFLWILMRNSSDDSNYWGSL